MLSVLVAIVVWFSFPFNKRIWQESQSKRPKLLRRKINFDILPFVLSFQIAMSGASTSRLAISQALKAIPSDQLPRTREHLSADLEISSGLLEDSIHNPELKPMALALAISEYSGARMGNVLDTLAAEVLKTRNEHAEIQAELAATKATVAVLAGLPLLGILMGSILGANPFAWLISNRYGLACLFVSVLLEVLGLLWIRRLVRSAMQ